MVTKESIEELNNEVIFKDRLKYTWLNIRLIRAQMPKKLTIKKMREYFFIQYASGYLYLRREE